VSRLHYDHNIILTWLIRINNVDAVNRISGLFAGHPDLLQGFETYMPQGNRIECGSSNEPNTISATGHPVATNSITLNKHAMYSNPPSDSDAGTPEFVKGAYQLSLANAGSSVVTILHDQTDASISVPASGYNIMRDVSMTFRCDIFRSKTLVAWSEISQQQIKLVSSISVTIKGTY
jgi:histone deacetylase complex regulatory component SIN3